MLDHWIKAVVGSTSVQTLSRKNVIAKKGLLVDTGFESVLEQEKEQVEMEKELGSKRSEKTGVRLPGYSACCKEIGSSEERRLEEEETQ